MARVGAREQAQLEERRAKVLELDIKGWTLDEIAAKSREEGWLPRPFNSKQAVWKDVQAALAERKARRNELAEQNIDRELAKLDMMERAAWAVADALHLVVNQGMVVYLESQEIEQLKKKQGWNSPKLDSETVRALMDERGNLVREPLIDKKPILDCIEKLLKIAERRSKLMGWDAPVKKQVEVSGGAQVGETIEQFIKLAFGSGAAIRFEPGKPAAPAAGTD